MLKVGDFVGWSSFLDRFFCLGNGFFIGAMKEFMGGAFEVIHRVTVLVNILISFWPEELVDSLGDESL